MSARVMSRSTFLITAGLVALGSAILIATYLGVAGEEATMWISDAGSALVNGLAALVVLVVAFKYGAGETVRRRWVLIGVGVAMFAIGDVVWTVYEAGLGLEPYPSWADAFYLAEYAFLFAGVMSAGLAYRELTNVRKPLVIGFGIAAVLAVAVFALVMYPNVWTDTELDLGTRALSCFYPVADSLLLVGPALFVAILLLILGVKRLSWPWWAVVLGMLMLSAADTAYYALDATGAEAPDLVWAMIDSGWMAAHVALAFAALFVRDVERVR